MQRIFKHHAKLSIVFFMLLLTSCGMSNKMHCEALVGKANDTDVAAKIEEWAIENVFQKELQRSDIKFEGRIIPGFYRYQAKFDWQILGFDPTKAQIRIVGPHIKDIVDDKVTNVKSVFFAERSRLGILVKKSDSEDYGVGSDKQFLTPISENVAVMCIPSD